MAGSALKGEPGVSTVRHRKMLDTSVGKDLHSVESSVSGEAPHAGGAASLDWLDAE